MLEINNFSKFYGDKKVVDNLSILVQSGDIYGFIGANEAGKTTTIKAVVGIHDFENESIVFIDLESGKVRGYNNDYAGLEEIAESFSSLISELVEQVESFS